jgi:hypothetical protein
VQVDETRDDELAGRVDPLHRPVDRDGGQDRGDLAVLDSEVPLAAEGLARIQHLAIGDDQIEAIAATQFRDEFLDRAASRFAYDVTNEQ